MSSLIDETPEGVNTPEFSVSELSGAVKRTVEGAFSHVRVRGEVGRVSRPRSGHMYLDLKDDRSVLAAVCWKGVAASLATQPEEGMEVIATGRLTTFAGQSRYQLVIEALEPAGIGALMAMLEKRRKALAAEGLFSAERKKALPFLPRVIGVVTSPSGAVIRDILHRLGERFPVRVIVWPVAVQGTRCAPEVTAAIQGFAALPPEGPVPRPDVLIVARGGGSIEDLWGFNEEAVVRAAAECPIPLISAVGHETDTTLIDFAADRRAPTPSAAAEMAVPVRAELAALLADLQSRRLRALQQGVTLRRQRLRDLARAMPRAPQIIAERRQRLDLASAGLPRPSALISDARQRLQVLQARLPRLNDLLVGPSGALGTLSARLHPALHAVANSARLRLAPKTAALSSRLLTAQTRRSRERLSQAVDRLAPAAARPRIAAADRLEAAGRLLATLGYQATLARGYAVVRDTDGSVVPRLDAAKSSAELEIEFADGRLAVATSKEVRPKPTRKLDRPRKKGPGSGGQGSLF